MPVDVDNLHRYTSLTPADTRTDVQLSGQLLTLLDKVSALINGTQTIESGKILRQVFGGGTMAPYMLDLVSSHMRLVTDDQRTYCVYDLTVRLDAKGGQSREIHIRSEGRSWLSYDRMEIVAVENAAKEISRQIPSSRSPATAASGASPSS